MIETAAMVFAVYAGYTHWMWPWVLPIAVVGYAPEVIRRMRVLDWEVRGGLSQRRAKVYLEGLAYAAALALAFFAALFGLGRIAEYYIAH